MVPAEAICNTCSVSSAPLLWACKAANPYGVRHFSSSFRPIQCSVWKCALPCFNLPLNLPPISTLNESDANALPQLLLQTPCPVLASLVSFRQAYTMGGATTRTIIIGASKLMQQTGPFFDKSCFIRRQSVHESGNKQFPKFLLGLLADGCMRFNICFTLFASNERRVNQGSGNTHVELRTLHNSIFSKTYAIDQYHKNFIRKTCVLSPESFVLSHSLLIAVGRGRLILNDSDSD